ncbi:MAG: hypothetical protein N7Q72_03110, partial [Spiroplasma sp. Tabriz.8]|nr:hypothetical protein [Spiroplasma sp. Tabriz.8]
MELQYIYIYNFAYLVMELQYIYIYIYIYIYMYVCKRWNEINDVRTVILEKKKKLISIILPL